MFCYIIVFLLWVTSLLNGALSIELEAKIESIGVQLKEIGKNYPISGAVKVGSSWVSYNYNVPVVKELTGDVLDKARKPLEPLTTEIPQLKRENIAFICPKVSGKASGVVSLRSFIRNFEPEQLAASTFEWYNPGIACYPAYLMFPSSNIKGGIVWLHGSGFDQQRLSDKFSSFVDRGYVVLCPNLFATFYTSSTVAQQLDIPLENSILAAYRALQLLKSCRDLKDKPIILMGESRGGTVTDLCARSFYQRNISPNLEFDGFVIIDGFSPLSGNSVEYTTKPMLLLHGRQDTWTPLAHIKSHKERTMPEQTKLVTFNCGHGVLATEDEKTKGVQTLKQCTVVEDDSQKGFYPLVYNEEAQEISITKMPTIFYHLQPKSRLNVLSYMPWNYVPRFIRRCFKNVTEWPAGKFIPWEYAPSFVWSRLKTETIISEHHTSSIKQQALEEIERFLDGRVAKSEQK